MSREIIKINNNWKFIRGEQELGFYRGLDDSSWRSVTLPHDWSVEEPFSKEHSSGTGYLPGGVGWYRKTFSLPENRRGSRVLVTFEGVYNNAQTWCNTYYIGKRPYGYSSFTYDITDFVEFGSDSNMLCVKVDHKDIADSRWFTGSGIYRNVYLTLTEEVHVEQYGVFASTPSVSKEQAQVEANIAVKNDGAQSVSIVVKNDVISPEGKETGSSCSELVLQAGESGSVVQNIVLSAPSLWSPDIPSLYRLVTRVLKDDVIVDEVITRIGIRWFHFDGDKGFFLNDQSMKLKGVCIHHDAGCLGAAVTPKVWTRRLWKLKEMGCNAIRMSHNPPSPELLDLCDEMGFLVMDEAFDEWEGVKNKWSTGHNVYPPKHFGYYEDFPEWGERDIKEMVLRDRNHPSIILWSIGNEVDYPNDPYCHPSFESMTGNNDANKPAAERQYDPNRPRADRLAVIAKKLAGYVKECDRTRPVTAALAFPELSNLTGYAELLDVVGYNYKEHLYQEDYLKYPGRVTYGSENSSSYEAWMAVRDNEYISGQFIWTGIDYLGEAAGWPVRVAQPGFLDTAGFQKPKYYYRKSLWNPEPMAYLSARRMSDAEYDNYRRWDMSTPHWKWQDGEKVEVICYTNCREAELFLNDRSLGKKLLTDAKLEYLSWEVVFEPGVLRIAALHRDGSKQEHELITAFCPTQLKAEADDLELYANGQNIAHVEIMVADAKGTIVCPGETRIAVRVEGPAELIGLENGNAQDLEPYSSKHRNSWNGKLLAYVRVSGKPGLITVRAEAPGLEAAIVTIKAK